MSTQSINNILQNMHGGRTCCDNSMGHREQVREPHVLCYLELHETTSGMVNMFRVVQLCKVME